VAAVMLALTLVTGVMMAAIPTRVHARPLPPPARMACGVTDVWLEQADRDVTHARYHAALHHLSMSQRDCPGSAQRDHLYALAYDGVGDHMAAIAAASRWVDSSHNASDACALFVTLAHPAGQLASLSDPRCP
jgi:hypothetical protein